MSEKSERPSWDEFFIAIATIYSSRGSCDRLRTACLLVNNKKIVGAGYNGSIAGQPTCDVAGHDMDHGHCVRTLHGEVNAIANTRNRADLNGATAYIIATPCFNCTKELAQNGIKRIVYVGHYDNKDGGRVPKYCRKSKIKLEQFTEDSKKIVSIFAKIFLRLSGSGGAFKDINVNLWLLDSILENINKR